MTGVGNRPWTVDRVLDGRVWPCVRVFIEFQIAACPRRRGPVGSGVYHIGIAPIGAVQRTGRLDDPWTQFMTSFLGNGERRYRDGDEENGEQERGWTEQEDGWQEVKVETVECDVPSRSRLATLHSRRWPRPRGVWRTVHSRCLFAGAKDPSSRDSQWPQTGLIVLPRHPGRID